MASEAGMAGVEEGHAMVGCVWKSSSDYHVMKWNRMEDSASPKEVVGLYILALSIWEVIYTYGNQDPNLP
jgi:hypothetical protein